ncbi:MAG: hypothetical protein AB1305_04105 [Candidatus Hadarchaeota archaeon]
MMQDEVKKENFRFQAAVIIAVIFVAAVISYVIAPPNSRFQRLSGFGLHIFIGTIVWLIWYLPGVMGRTSLWLLKIGEIFAEGLKKREGVLCRVPQKRQVGAMATLSLAFVLFMVTIAPAVMIFYWSSYFNLPTGPNVARMVTFLVFAIPIVYILLGWVAPALRLVDSSGLRYRVDRQRQVHDMGSILRGRLGILVGLGAILSVYTTMGLLDFKLEQFLGLLRTLALEFAPVALISAFFYRYFAERKAIKNFDSLLEARGVKNVDSLEDIVKIPAVKRKSQLEKVLSKVGIGKT